MVQQGYVLVHLLHLPRSLTPAGKELTQKWNCGEQKSGGPTGRAGRMTCQGLDLLAGGAYSPGLGGQSVPASFGTPGLPWPPGPCVDVH